MVVFRHFCPALLALFIPGILAGGCFSSLRDPDSDPSTPDNDIWAVCQNESPPGGWACQQAEITFPTLECIKADLATCGLINSGSTVFYSMGATTVATRTGLRDKLSPRGIMFNDAMGQRWWQIVGGNPGVDGSRPDFNLVGQQARQDYLRNLFAIAMAQSSSGEVFLVTGSRTSAASDPGPPGIFQNPIQLPNIWRQMELPNLQRNPDITAITHVDMGKNFARNTDWRQGDGNLYPLPDIDFGSPPAPAKVRRDNATDSCPLPSATSTTPTSSTKSTITAAPDAKPSCDVYGPDPDRGVDAYCLCNESSTLKILSTGGAYASSCAYTNFPGATASATVTTETSVWTTNCVACTDVGGVVGSETCTTVAGCTPTATPTYAAWVANLSTIDIGNADDGNDGKDLAKEMFTKLKGMCSGSSCKSDHAEMDNVEAAIADGEEPLKPAMYLQDAQYTSEDVLEKMLSIGISSWIAALNNEDLGLCKNVTYEAEADETGSGCGSGPISPNRLRRKIRRDDGHVLWERGGLALEERQLAERCLDNCGAPLNCHYEARMCSAPNEITVVMSDGKDPYANHLNIGVTLDETAGEGFMCEEVAAAITAAMAILAPELLSADALEGVELEALCGLIDDPLSAIPDLQNTVKVAT
ncbi:hypothetical protein E8E14_010700 [Neopestalotiopsis sp. 37M]|nr:hypothetical protein E8E14_010700 [Neopestalotiopsis sp. 37M]